MSWLVAIVLAICLPFGQLQTAVERVECCCPDPDHCKCPDHQPDHSGQQQMRSCHKRTHDGLANELASFVAPTLHMTIAPALLAPRVAHVLPAPHAEPPPQRPAAPS